MSSVRGTIGLNRIDLLMRLLLRDLLKVYKFEEKKYDDCFPGENRVVCMVTMEREREICQFCSGLLHVHNLLCSEKHNSRDPADPAWPANDCRIQFPFSFHYHFVQLQLRKKSKPQFARLTTDTHCVINKMSIFVSYRMVCRVICIQEKQEAGQRGIGHLAALISDHRCNYIF